MRIIIQRVREAKVTVGEKTTGAIGLGFLLLLGIEDVDTHEDAQWLAQKLAGMRIFSDEDGKMNRDIIEAKGDVLVVSQFTLYASTKKGNRPSFIRAARPEQAIPLYEFFIDEVSRLLGKPVSQGEFGAMMDVHLVNDGPVTIIVDSRDRE